ncbi:MAG: prepilin-type N-terminal cleavage/methylation domain-containing protein [Planctomycetes bacterium]|nr:prepilin-type N-terminal cleavage/methylation domain-containing protein [Planctomycetota bacterium]
MKLQVTVLLKHSDRCHSCGSRNLDSSRRHSGRGNDKGVRNSYKGMTLLELMISVSLLAVILGGVLSLYLAGIETYETGSAYATAEMMLQLKLDEVMDEVAETAEPNLAIYSWVDPLFAPVTETQEAMCFSSARNAAGQFVTNNGRPVWQSVVVLAPYLESGRGQIRRYESFGVYTFPISVTNISNTTITLSNGVTFNRDAGRIILGNVEKLDTQAMWVDASQNPISISIRVKVYLPKGEIKTVTLQSFIDCRNANESGAGGLFDE